MRTSWKSRRGERLRLNVTDDIEQGCVAFMINAPGGHRSRGDGFRMCAMAVKTWHRPRHGHERCHGAYSSDRGATYGLAGAFCPAGPGMSRREMLEMGLRVTKGQSFGVREPQRATAGIGDESVFARKPTRLTADALTVLLVRMGSFSVTSQRYPIVAPLCRAPARGHGGLFRGRALPCSRSPQWWLPARYPHEGEMLRRQEPRTGRYPTRDSRTRLRSFELGPRACMTRLTR